MPSWAAAVELVFVGTGFVSRPKGLDWDDAGAYVPSVLTDIVMPFTFSFANGTAIGSFTYAVIRIVTGNVRDPHSAVELLGAASLLYFLEDF